MFLAKSNYKPKPEKPKLTERQRFERWFKRTRGYTPDRKGSGYWLPSVDNEWVAWQASARAKR